MAHDAFDRKAKRDKAKHHGDATKFFQEGTSAFDGFVASLPPAEVQNNPGNNTLAYYLQKNLPDRDYHNDVNAHASDVTGKIERQQDKHQQLFDDLRDDAADKIHPFSAVRDVMHSAVSWQKDNIVTFYDQAKAKIERDDPDNKVDLLTELKTSRDKALTNFDTEASKKLTSTHQKAAQEKALEKDFMRTYLLSLQDEAILEEIRKLKAQGDPSSGGVASVGSENDGLYNKVELSDLDKIKTATGNLITKQADGSYKLTTSKSTIGDLWYRWGGGKKPYADALTLAALVKSQSDTIHWDVSMPKGRVKDKDKRDELVLKQAQLNYEASIEAGFKPEDIGIKVTLSDGKSFVYGKVKPGDTLSEKRSIENLFGSEAKQNLAISGGSSRRNQRLERLGIHENKTSEDAAEQTQAYRDFVQENKKIQDEADEEIAMPKPL